MIFPIFALVSSKITKVHTLKNEWGAI